uniref:Mediator complex subunit 15 KIX domain-containing protein n=1 Tax=Asterionellopsis glacialis TaxID=33640 RepID=A0A7S0KWS8_9STRA|mmetsp:Transcript_1165/g.1619  ORF Transcript_1165/g.1619 Transcript_1165/m.1619 type:complete len:192 (+) Transcript_1165:198-773(+)
MNKNFCPRVMNVNQPLVFQSSAANNYVGSMNGSTGTSSLSSSSSSSSSAIRHSSTTTSQQMLSTEQKAVGDSSPKINRVDFTTAATNRTGATASLPTVEHKQHKRTSSSKRTSSRQEDWSSQNKNLRERKLVLFYITRILKKKDGSNKENSIEKAAFRLESILYRNSQNKEEYLDKSTLKSRIRNVLQSIE